jgi:hypothetical protein
MRGNVCLEDGDADCGLRELVPDYCNLHAPPAITTEADLEPLKFGVKSCEHGVSNSKCNSALARATLFSSSHLLLLFPNPSADSTSCCDKRNLSALKRASIFLSYRFVLSPHPNYATLYYGERLPFKHY